MPYSLSITTLWEKYIAQPDHDIYARALANYYLPLVSTVVNALPPSIKRHYPINELESIGTLGLLQAMKKYIPGKVPFEPFAYPYIRFAILGELRAQDPLSRTDRARYRKIMESISAFKQREGKPPTTAQLAHILKLSENQIELTLALGDQKGTSIDVHDESFSHQNAMSVMTPGPDEEIHYKLAKENLSKAWVKLTPMEQKVLHYRENDMPLKEVAAKLNLSQGRVSQYYTQAIKKLKTLLNAQYSYDKPL